MCFLVDGHDEFDGDDISCRMKSIWRRLQVWFDANIAQAPVDYSDPYMTPRRLSVHIRSLLNLATLQARSKLSSTASLLHNKNKSLYNSSYIYVELWGDSTPVSARSVQVRGKRLGEERVSCHVGAGQLNNPECLWAAALRCRPPLRPLPHNECREY